MTLRYGYSPEGKFVLMVVEGRPPHEQIRHRISLRPDQLNAIQRAMNGDDPHDQLVHEDLSHVQLG